jgi:hypothetical protein
VETIVVAACETDINGLDCVVVGELLALAWITLKPRVPCMVGSVAVEGCVRQETAVSREGNGATSIITSQQRDQQALIEGILALLDTYSANSATTHPFSPPLYSFTIS